MKGDPKVIDVLNSLLAEELTAINQYMVHSEMCDDWGYEKLHKSIEKRAIDEMKHAEKLIGRILFWKAHQLLVNTTKSLLAKTISEMYENDHVAEADTIKSYNSAIALCGEARDYATRDILEAILNDEDAHIDNIEAIQDEIEQMGIQVSFPCS